MSGEERLKQLKVSAVVPAAGLGDRMSCGTPKQYIEVCGAPLVTHCIRALSNPSWMCDVVVVADNVEKMLDAINKENIAKVRVVQGEDSRHRSILKGMMSLVKDPPDIVVIHDGARPIVPYHILSEVVLKSVERGAAGVVRPLVSTVLVPDEKNLLQESLRRCRYKNSEMPQAFNFQMLLESYKKCSPEELDIGTECLAIALNYGGVQAYLVEGSSELWKVTYPEDVETARLILPKYVQRLGIFCLHCHTGVVSIVGSDGKLKTTDQTSETMEVVTDAPGHLCPLVVREAPESLQPNASASVISLTFEGKFSTSAIPELICLETRKVLSSLSDVINKSFYETYLVEDVTLNELKVSYLLVISCIEKLTDVNRILVELQSAVSHRATRSLILVLMDTQQLKDNRGVISSIRKFVQSYLKDNNTVNVIICSQTEESGSLFESPNRRNRLAELLDVCFSKYGRNLHGQILYC